MGREKPPVRDDRPVGNAKAATSAIIERVCTQPTSSIELSGRPAVLLDDRFGKDLVEIIGTEPSGKRPRP